MPKSSSIQPFRYNTDLWQTYRQTDRQTDRAIANTVLAQRRAGKISLKYSTNLFQPILPTAVTKLARPRRRHAAWASVSICKVRNGGSGKCSSCLLTLFQKTRNQTMHVTRT